MRDIYQHWNSREIQEKYSQPRKWAERFRSERFFWERIGRTGMSVLDVGCAAGDLYHGLKERFGSVRYIGMDSSEVLLARAREMAPEVPFIARNALEGGRLDENDSFDVVTATGLFQHEPEQKRLMQFLLDHTKEDGHLLFDVKLFHNHPSIKDINGAYADHEDRVYFIVYHFSDFIDFLLSLPEVSSIACYGYYAGIHQSVHLPESVTEKVCSAHFLIKVGKRTPDGRLEINLPFEFLVNYFQNK